MRSTTLWCTLATMISVSLASTIPLQQQPFASPQASSLPSLTDLLTRSKNSRIFYDYIRESTSVSTRLTNPLESTTILSPLNSAILSLSRKPHQGPLSVQDYALGSREDEQVRAQYLEQWIKRHLIAGKINLDNILEQGKEYDTLYNQGQGAGTRAEKVWFEKGQGEVLYKVMPGNVDVVEIEQVSFLFILSLFFRRETFFFWETENSFKTFVY